MFSFVDVRLALLLSAAAVLLVAAQGEDDSKYRPLTERDAGPFPSTLQDESCFHELCWSLKAGIVFFFLFFFFSILFCTFLRPPAGGEQLRSPLMRKGVWVQLRASELGSE